MKYSVLAPLGLLFLALPAAAQLPMGARALGAGGAYVAAARGHEALFVNPANLALSDNPVWSFSLPQAGVGSTILGPAFEDLPDAINFDDATQARKAEILGLIPESGTEVRVDARLPLLSLSTRSVAFGVGYGMVGEHTLGRDIVDLLFNGYQEGRTDYSVGATEGERATYFDAALALARRVGPVSVGVTGHYYRGGTLMRSRLFEPRFHLATQDFEMSYVGVLAKGGHGYGVDVGAAVQPVRSLTLSAVVANAASKMTWSEELRMRRVTITRGDLDDPDVVLRRLMDYKHGETEVDVASAPLEVVETAQELYREAYFPTLLRLGGSWSPLSPTLLAASYETRLSGGRLSGRWERTAAVGVEQRISGSRWNGISLRAGFASDLGESRAITAGLSLGPLQVGVAKLRDGARDGAERTGYLATFGLSAGGFYR